jgi:hypothetical protein
VRLATITKTPKAAGANQAMNGGHSAGWLHPNWGGCQDCELRQIDIDPIPSMTDSARHRACHAQVWRGIVRKYALRVIQPLMLCR